MPLYPIILSGGSGTRLWPLSRELYPKQLLPLTSERTMLQETVSRLDGLKGDVVAEPLVVCNEEHRFLVAEQLRAIGRKPAAIILEPVGRNTAPALTLAALAVQEREAEALMLVMPADHVIRDVDSFHEAVSHGRELAEQGAIVTFGIVPHRAETGYGYIRRGDPVTNDAAICDSGKSPAHRIAAFVEKPDGETAETYLASGDYYWNSGMFMMQASTWLEQIERYQPDILDACRSAFGQGCRDQDFFRVDGEAFTACPSDSIDYAVMEKLVASEITKGPQAAQAVVVPLAAGWSDIGAWPALWEIRGKDAEGNVIKGDVFAEKTSNSLLLAEHRFLATVGLENIVVIETADAVMVTHKDHAQDVKKVVEWLKDHRREERLSHKKVYRPWGAYEGIDIGHRYKVKRITVNPGASLSLQMHHHRAEHWIVVKGTARVTRGDENFLVSENESTFIPLGTQHRLENPGTIPLEMIEVQSGSYLGEDDIVRFEDKYGR